MTLKTLKHIAAALLIVAMLIFLVLIATGHAQTVGALPDYAMVSNLPNGVEVFEVGGVGFVIAHSQDGSDVELVKFCPGECGDGCEAGLSLELTPWPDLEKTPVPEIDETPVKMWTREPEATSTSPSKPAKPTATGRPTATAKSSPTPTIVTAPTRAPAPTATVMIATARPVLSPCGEGKTRICKAGHSKSQCVATSSLGSRKDDYTRGPCPGEALD